MGQHMRRAAAMLAMCVLSACAFAPGMSFNKQGTGGNEQASSTGGQPTVDVGTVAGVPKDHVVEITSQLIDQQRAVLPKGIPTNVEGLFGKPQAYVISPGDVLNIVIWDHPELTMPAGTGADSAAAPGSVVTGYAVDENGKIQFAYLGTLKVAGLTESEAREKLTDELGRYLRHPQVTVRIQAYRSKRVYIDGEVHTPGMQVINDAPMTLPEAINRAGGFTPTADRSSVAVTRGDATVVVNLPDLIAKGVNPSQILLHDGDMVRVYSSADSKVFVLGEVGHASTVTLNNGTLSLNEALGDAGGVNQNSGDAKQVYVVRGKGQPNATVYHLDASSPASMALADNFELKPNDLVFVDASALARWSRVLNLLIPSGGSSVVGAFVP
jgi:polysaccharide export outer membrane protein